ncbi:thioesterase II family protein [Clostridium gasigenes]|uniref:thioesterase II family protein n=1 Tax=Clostridium gasigenes TaxID=94869 RepID=UPI001C0D306A|nr:thioesterase domain-containing protein [Clostridium gasigenes]MBU3102832.1 thioesterase [Clostridium gasigenes]
MRLFCLPYAGGSEVIYYSWKKKLNPSIKLESIELKGRGKRYGETFYETLDEAVEDIFIHIKEKILKDDYAIYGHSMGALLAYELYYKISDLGFRKPKHIFFSGHEAPSVIKKRESTYKLSDYDFLNKVIKLGGTSEELMNNKELFKIYLPIIRSDFLILENYNYKEMSYKIQCDVSILNGKKDDISLDGILSWKKHVEKGFKVYNFEGNHFYMKNNVENIINVINGTLII